MLIASAKTGRFLKAMKPSFPVTHRARLAHAPGSLPPQTDLLQQIQAQGPRVQVSKGQQHLPRKAEPDVDVAVARVAVEAAMV